MKYLLNFLPVIEEDIKAAYYWYESKSEGLGKRFEDPFYQHCIKVSEDPFIYTKKYKEFRRCLMKHFPYAIYYKIINHNMIIWGIFHCSRSPHSMKTTLNDRN